MRADCERPRIAALPVAALCTAVASGCAGAEEASTAEAVRRDSAGVEIVISPAESPAWPVAPTPSLSIGQVEGDPDYQLFRVVGAQRLTDGRLVIANAGSHELRFYDPSGRFLARAGGEGEGPGEFQQMSSLDVSLEDSLSVWDARQRRRSVFTPSGEFARDHRLDEPWDGGFPNYVGSFPDGTLLVSVGELVSELPEDRSVMRRDNLVLRYTAVGQPIDTIGRFTTQSSFLRVYDGGRGGLEFFNLPLDQGTVWAPGGRGVYETSGPAHEIRELGADAALVRLLRVDRPPQEVTPEIRAAEIEGRLAVYTNDEARENARDSYESMPLPDFVQAYDRMLVDGLDHLWARGLPFASDAAAIWRVFDETGRLVGHAALPAALQVWQVGADFVLGSMRDELDIERVMLFGISRPQTQEIRG